MHFNPQRFGTFCALPPKIFPTLNGKRNEEASLSDIHHGIDGLLSKTSNALKLSDFHLNRYNIEKQLDFVRVNIMSVCLLASV